MSNLTPSSAALLGLTGTSVACSAFSALYCAYKKGLQCKSSGSSAGEGDLAGTSTAAGESGDETCQPSPCQQKLHAARDESLRNVPALLAVIFAAHMCGKSRVVVDPLAPAVLAAGFTQAMTHFCDHPIAKKIRCALQTVQTGILGFWVLQLFEAI